MGRPSDARSRLIRVASALFRQRGYDGVGLTEILEASGAPKGSFYHHFPEGKEQLAAICMLYAGEQAGALIDAAMAEAPDFATGIRRLAGSLADWFERSGFREGCPITSIALATTPQSAPHREAAQAVLKDWEQRLLAHSSRLGVQLSPASTGLFLMLMEGAWIVGRIRQSKEPLLYAAEVFLTFQTIPAPAPSQGLRC
jgi:TetR/AcrR family transcriptional regulator, lmrAB and yxaGH operons repressor